MKKVSLLLMLLCSVYAYTTRAQSTESIYKRKASPNETGLQLGFWETFNKQDYTLKYLGKRPSSRVGFTSWASIETIQGEYEFGTVFNVFKRVHQYGESILGAVNISFSSKIVPENSTIPRFYPDDITDSTTRRAAKRFLAAYVKEALNQVGSLTLTIDYEICSNYRLSSSDPERNERAAIWGAWYVEAVAVARKAAAEMGKSDQLKLQPIVNGNPLEKDNPIGKGTKDNQWLVNAVKVSDYLALDTYFSEPAYPNTSAETTIKIIQFWIDTYADDKDVVVTENGFTTITEINPDITREDRNYKTTGTESDQAAFYTDVFKKLNEANKSGGVFKNKLRGYHIWSIRDNTAKPVGDEDRYFGLVGIDASGTDYAKPALPVVQQGFASLEADPFHRPYDEVRLEDVSAALLAGNADVPLQYKSGNEFEFLRYTHANLPKADTYTYILKITTQAEGNIIVRVNKEWVFEEANTQFNMDITKYCIPNASNVIDVYCTSSKFPFVQRVKAMQVVRKNKSAVGESSAKTALVVSPNPVESTLSISGIDGSQPFTVDVYTLQGQRLLKSVNTTQMDVSKLPAGIYYVRFQQGNAWSHRKFIKL